MKLRFSEPVVVSMGPDSRIQGWKGWGAYQFPSIMKLDNGALVYRFNTGADSEKAYSIICRIQPFP